MSSHASAAPSLSGRRPRALPQQHHDEGLDAPTLDPRSLAIVTELRTMRTEFNDRFNDVAVRLVAVEQRHQPVRDDPVDDSLSDHQAAPVDHGRRPSTMPIHPPSGRTRPSAETAWSPALLEDRFVTTTRGPSRSRPAQPPVTPRPLPSELPPAPSTSPYGTIPLARYKQLPGAEQGRIKKALRRIGLSLEHILGSADAVEEDDPLDDDEAFDDEPPVQSPPPALSTPARPVQADSSESPIRIRGHVAATPTPELSPAPNIRIGAPPVCRQEFIGEYNGDPYRLEAFLGRVGNVIRTNSDPQWLPAVFRALPIALRGNAAKWHESLSNKHAKELNSFEKWEVEMRKTFKVNQREQRRSARDRVWVPEAEWVAAYYFDKLRALRQAFGFDQTDDELVTEIKDGFPTSFIAMLRLPRQDATLEQLVDEMGECEPQWRTMYNIASPPETATSNEVGAGVPSTTPATPQPMALRRLQGQAMVRSASAPLLPAVRPIAASAPQAPRAAPAAPSGLSAMAAAYDPARVIPAANGEPRKYRVDGRETPMRLNRPCSKCNGDHFNFEHIHLVPQVRVMAIHEDDDYPFDNDVGSANAYMAVPSVQTVVEEELPSQEPDISSIPMERNPAPSMSNSQSTAPHDDPSPVPPETEPQLFFSQKNIFSATRQLPPNETLPPLSQPKRAFGRIVPLARNAATGTGKGYRSHVPLTMHVRINDTDGRAMLSLLDTGASLSCIDADLLRRMGGQPTGTPMKVHGIGAATTLGWVTLPLFIQAQDPHGQHAHLELEQDFHVLPSFAPGMCLGLDFIDAHGVGISPVRGRGRIGTFTFQVHERLAGPFASEAELCVTHDVDLPAGTQAWVPVNASCLAPDVDYTVGPRMCVSPDETVRLAGPVGVLTHASERHILVGNHGVALFILPRGTVIADAVAARVGDTVSSAAEAFTLCPLTPRHEAAVGFSLAVDETDPVLPIDAFADEAAATHSLAQDVATTLVDDVFRVGIGEHGTADDDLVALLRRHKAAFALDGRPGRIVGHDMGIQLQPGAVLQSEAPHRASPEKRTAMDAAIQQLLDWDVIEPSASPVSFPVVMVRQQGKWRFCVDYRKLNADTIPDRYPLPTIDSIFQTLCGKKVFSSLDAIRGYHQLGVKEDDRWKTAFVCHKGLFQYKTVPFGLRNAPAVFQRLMDKVLGPLRWNQAVVYIDDAVVATDTMAEHIQALDTLLQSATDVGLKFSPAKCTFGVPSLTLLGRKVSGAGVAIWEDRAQAIATLARPTTLQELYHTLGLFGYYRAFVPNFAIRAAPLTRLLKGWRYESADGHTRLVNTEGKAVAAGRVPIAWGPEQQDSFEGLRHAIANPPVLAHPDPSRPYLLYTDASKHALAAILHQVSSSSASVPASNPHAKLNTLTIPQLPFPFARQRWRSWLEEDRYFAPLLRQARDTPTASDEWVIQDEILVRRVDDRVALPLAALPVVLKAVHDDGGHFGFTKTLLAVRNHFWRPHLATSVRAWVKHCTECQRIKTAPKTGVLDVSKDASLPFEAVYFDLIYGFPRSRSGNDAALVMQDLFSRMILLEPCHKEITAEGVAAIVSNRILRFGWRPKRLVSDSEARVSGSVLSALAASLGAVPTPSSPYHQQANSVERAIQIAQQVLQVLSLDSKAHWDRRLLPSVELAMNSSPSTVTGHRPFDLVFLSHPSVVHAVFDADEHLGVSSFKERLAAGHERLDTARRQISVARLDQKRRFDSRRARPLLISAGMRAWIRLCDRPIAGAIGDKLDVRKLGPFEVEEVLSPHRVRLCLPPHLDIDPVLNIEQLDFAPSDMDPFAAHRPSSAAVEAGSPELRVDGGSQELRADGSLQGDISGGVGELSSSRSGEDRYSSVAIDAAALPPRRVRHLPESMRDFHVGTVQPAPSPELLDLLRGPLPRPRSFQEGNDLLVLSERPVAFISRLTSPAEEKLVAAELELVCLAWAFHKLAHLLEGASLTVITDHAPMERMLRSTNSITYGPTVTRCRALIMPHLGNSRFIYRPGPRHTNADALSRLIPDQGRSASGGGDVLASQTIIDE